MVPLEGGVAEMTKRWHSTEAAGGALMAKWFRTRGGEVGAAVGAVDVRLGQSADWGSKKIWLSV
jgi:hypothetical protein